MNKNLLSPNAVNQGMSAAVCQSKPPTQLQEQINSLCGVSQRLDSLLDILGERLSPILVTNYPSKDESMGETPEETLIPAADSIRFHRKVIERLNDRLDQLISRIQA